MPDSLPTFYLIDASKQAEQCAVKPDEPAATVRQDEAYPG
jgi:hypothetical protein